MPLGNNITSVKKGTQQIAAIYKGSQVVWQNFKPVENVVFRGNYTNAANRSNYTYSNVPIGAANTSRWVMACFGSSTNVYSITSATIGGVTATVVQNPSSHPRVAIAWLLVPSGTAATIRFNISNTMANGQIHVYTFNAGSGLNVLDSAANASTAQNVTLSDIEVKEGALVIGVLGGFAGASSVPVHSWNGVDSATKDSDLAGEFDFRFSCSHVLSTEASIARDYSIHINSPLIYNVSRYVVSFESIP